MAKKGTFGKPVTGSNVEGYGAKKGKTGLDPRFNTDIKTDVFSSDWTSPLNMANPKDPMIDPDEGAIITQGAKALGLPPNPLGIENLEPSTSAENAGHVGKFRSGKGK